MDSSAWIHHGYGGGGSSSSVTAGGNSGFMCGYSAGCVDSAAGLRCREDEQEVLVSSQIQHHLNQISMHMNMDDELVYGNGAAVGIQNSVVDVGFDFLPSHHASSFHSSSSSSFPSASLSCSPESSAHLLTQAGGPAASAGCLQYPEVSSHVPLVDQHVVLPFVDDVSFDDMAAMAAPERSSTSAFRHYSRHLGPRRRTTKPGGASGQRMFKTAMSVLSKMHTAMRYRQQYSYQQVPAADDVEQPSSGNQLQHMISERKRREKLNESFHALKAVLPPGPKKDKTSILITAREYVTSLKSKLYELEEKNQALESRLARRAAAADEDDADSDAECESDADEKVEIEITRSAAAAAAAEVDAEPRETCTVKIALRPACGNTTDVVLRTLQYLKDEVGHDVSLLAMSTSDGASTADGRASLTLQLQSASGAKWEDAAVKEAVTKAVAEALPSQAAETSTAAAGGSSAARTRRSTK